MESKVTFFRQVCDEVAALIPPESKIKKRPSKWQFYVERWGENIIEVRNIRNTWKVYSFSPNYDPLATKIGDRLKQIIGNPIKEVLVLYS